MGMTKSQKELKIEFFKNEAGLWEQLDGWYRGRDLDHLILDNEPFEATLEYIDFKRGRSALNTIWKDSERGMVVYAGMPLLHNMLVDGKVEGNKIKGTFIFKKQGTSILLAEYNE